MNIGVQGWTSPLPQQGDVGRASGRMLLRNERIQSTSWLIVVTARSPSRTRCKARSEMTRGA